MKSRHCCTPSSHGFPISPLILLLFLLLTPILRVVEAQRPSNPASSNDDGAVSGGEVSPSMAMIVIVLVLGFFITGSISVYIQLCTDRSSVGGGAAVIARNGNLMRASQRGLDQSVIDTFPTFLYSDVKELKFGKGALECAVCLNEFEKDDTLRLLPKCDHVFHPQCIDAWLMAHTTCPVCRANLVPDPSESASKEDSHHSYAEAAESGTSCEPEMTVVEPLPPKGTRVPRSHSTGHSLVGPGEDRERFTLRLPDEVLKQLRVAQPKLTRSASLMALQRVSSSRRGYRSNGGEGGGSSRYGLFFGRSFRWATKNNGGDGDVGDGSKRFFGSVVTPIEALPRLPV